jgi:acetyl-CoA C-acetyltransferase
MVDAYIVAATRLAGGRRNGRLRNWHPADMGGKVLDELVRRAAIDPAAVDDVIMGCVGQVGEQSSQVGRSAVYASSLPQSVPAVTIDRQCGSSQQAVHFAAQAVMSGVQDVVIAAGLESMTRVPMGLPVRGSIAAGASGAPWSSRGLERFGVKEFSQFNGAQMIADKYGFTREQLDAFGLQSHRRAAAATHAGAFADEILVVEGHDADGNPVLHD